MESQPIMSLTKPRRKTSSSSGRPIRSRTTSWNYTVNDQDRNVFDEDHDAMDTDDTPLPDPSIDHPLREMADRIGKEVEIFAEELDKYLNKAKKSEKSQKREIASIVNKYKTCADTTVQQLKRKYGSGLCEKFQNDWISQRQPHGDQDMDADYQTGIEDLDRWQREAQTWKLFQSMLKSDYPDLPVDDAKTTKSMLSDRFSADGASWYSFLAKTPTARERYKVLQWLEESAEQTGKDIELLEDALANKSERGAGLLYGSWMDTREKIKAEKRLRLWNSSKNSGLPNITSSDGQGLLVTQLDPDAVVRQGRSLEHADERFEHAFWELCWEMLRRGNSMETIHNWCADRNEIARAVALGASAPEESEVAQLTPGVRFLWRQACAVAAKNSLTDHENAVFGLLSGQIEATTAICRGWSDHLLILYNNRLVQQYLVYLASQNMLNISNQALGPLKISAGVSLEEERIDSAQSLVSSLESDPASRVDPNIPYEPVQAALISHEFVEHVQFQGAMLVRTKHNIIGDLIQEEPADLIPAGSHTDFVADTPDILRVLTHMLLVLQDLGVSFGEGKALVAAENIICGYLRFLLLAGKRHLIPVYASRLSPATGIDVLARTLPIITNQKEQTDFVKLIEEAGIDVAEVFTHQVTLAMLYSPTVTLTFQEAPAEVALITSTTEHYWPGFRIRQQENGQMLPSDLLIIRALEWFLYVDGRWARTFESLTNVAIAFFRSGSINLALELFDTIPFVTVSKAKTPEYMAPPIDVTDESEEDNEPSDSDNDARMALYHLSPRKEHRINRSFGEPTRLEQPEKMKVQRDLYKAHAQTYFELGQLVTALQALYAWREMEDEALKARRNTDRWKNVKRECKKVIDHLVSSMEPLLHNFLTTASPCVQPPEVLQDIRRAYLPQMVLAYASALQCAGYFLSKDHLLQSLDLATNVADNDVLVEDIKSQGLMGTLVEAFARASKSLLHLRENSATSKRRERPGSTIWVDMD